MGIFSFLSSNNKKEVEINEPQEYDVVGESFDNQDGTNRQDILKKCSVGGFLTLKSTKYKGKPAVEVWSKFGQIGFIGKEEAVEVSEYIQKREVLKTLIHGIYGGTEKKPMLGCSIDIFLK